MFSAVKYWVAFIYLSGQRGLGYGTPMPISVSDINAYLVLNEVTELEHKLDYLYYITELDKVWLENLREKTEQEQRKQGRAKSRGR